MIIGKIKMAYKKHLSGNSLRWKAPKDPFYLDVDFDEKEAFPFAVLVNGRRGAKAKTLENLLKWAKHDSLFSYNVEFIEA